MGNVNDGALPHGREVGMTSALTPKVRNPATDYRPQNFVTEQQPLRAFSHFVLVRSGRRPPTLVTGS